MNQDMHTSIMFSSATMNKEQIYYVYSFLESWIIM